ncbi:N-acetyltransferase family protein [Piscinibacter sakaiensis]|uniref:N-acetyltransferase family protein n=1 Tax=Piscinibacter sakaiensis TaxID=1547922 RepID=UPI003AB0A983
MDNVMLKRWLVPVTPSTDATTTGPLPQTVLARDRRSVLLRHIVPGDETLLDEFFAGLTPAARRLRFHGGVRTVSRQVLQRMTHWDAQRELALLALAETADGPRCIAEARYALADDAVDEREFALVVDDNWQGVGIGGALLQRLIASAERQQVGRLIGDVVADNDAMISLARRHEFQLRSHPGDARLRLLSRTLQQQPVEQPQRLPLTTPMPRWVPAH